MTTPRPDGQSWLSEALATRDLERVKPDMAAAGHRINEAASHVRSARTLAKDDVTLAMSACHDAIRKAIAAHMSANGLRARSGDGAHRIINNYARHQLENVITAADLDDADSIRRDRILAEYGDFASAKLSAVDVRTAADTAERIVTAIAKTLAAQAKPPHRN